MSRSKCSSYRATKSRQWRPFFRKKNHNGYVANAAAKTVGKLYRGFTLNLAREGIFTMVYLGIYHWVMANSSSSDQSAQGTDSFNHVLFVAGTSAVTGAMAWVASYPFDVAKTMIQSGSSFQQVRGMWERNSLDGGGGGLKAFFRGCLPSTGRAMLVTSSRMIAYDQVIRYFATKPT